MNGVRIVLGGTQKVYCVHDRLKRVVTDPEHVKYLGQAAGINYDPRLHKLQNCPCCSNLFVALNDMPALCPQCQGPAVHALEASLPEPQGVVE